MRLAYTVHGHGPPIVRAATWLTHLEFDWASPVWRHWLEGLTAGHTLVRYDERGCGLSDREVGHLSVDTWVADLETVVDAVGIDHFALLGISQAAAIAVVYATRHPERVSHLILYGGYARGRKLRGQRRQEEALASRDPSPAGRTRIPRSATSSACCSFRAARPSRCRGTTTCSAGRHHRKRRCGCTRHAGTIDVVDLAPQVTSPTLVIHARDDRAVPADEGRTLGALIPDARLVLLDSANHILLWDEPAWPAFLAEVRGFLGTSPAPGAGRLEDLSDREYEVLELIATGMTNDAIAERLVISVRTVERHLSNIYAKLGVSGKAGRAAAAAAFAETRGSRASR